MHQRLASRTILAPVMIAAFALLLTADPARAAAGTYNVDPAHSSFYFRIAHMNLTYVYGRFDRAAGQLHLDDDPAKCTFQITLEADSINTGVQKRDVHLRGSDFFDVKQFPLITFKSTAVTKTETGYDVTGDLSMHGVTKSVTIPITRMGESAGPKEARVGLTAEFDIKRSEFGITLMPEGLGEQVRMLIGIEAVKQ